MGSIQWDSAWNIGHSEIDHQHQRWVELLNELDSAFLSKDIIDLAVIQQNIFKAG